MPPSPEIGLELGEAVIRHRCAELAGEKDPRVISGKLREVAAALKLTAMALDPIPAIQHIDKPAPPPRPVDLARFTPLAEDIRAALKNDTVARQCIPLLQDGELAALQIASCPRLHQRPLRPAQRHPGALRRPHPRRENRAI